MNNIYYDFSLNLSQFYKLNIYFHINTNSTKQKMVYIESTDHLVWIPKPANHHLDQQITSPGRDKHQLKAAITQH